MRQQRKFNSLLRPDPKELGIVTGHVEALEHELQSRTPGFAFAPKATFTQSVGVAFLSRCYRRSRIEDGCEIR